MRGVNTSPYYQPGGPLIVGSPRLLIVYIRRYPPYECSLFLICRPGSGDVVMTGHNGQGTKFRIRTSGRLFEGDNESLGAVECGKYLCCIELFGVWQRSQWKSTSWEEQWNRTFSFIISLNDPWIFRTIVYCTGILYYVFSWFITPDTVQSWGIL